MAGKQVYSEVLEFVQDLALVAGNVMLKYFDANQHEQTKKDGTPVTIADKEINDIVIKEVKSRYPDDEIVGEEASTDNYGAGRRWICDPIDGTAAYVMGVPTATFSLALAIDGKPTVAVIYEPHRKQLYSAVKGEGSYCNDKRLHVSTDSFEDGLIALAPDYIRPDLINDPFLQRLLAYDKQLAMFPGAAMRSCLVASGRLAGFPHPRVNPYDIAAAHLIVEEAGGKVTGLRGETLDYTKNFRGAIISNSIAHQKLIDLFD